MKTLILLLAMTVGAIANAQAQNEGKIQATVTNLQGDQGEVLFALYTADKFMKQEPDFSAKASIIDGQAKVNFEKIPAGTYSLVVLHDKNGNGRMDFDSSGMPQEAYGTSGNSFSYGPPNWADSNFSFDGETEEIVIRL
ncbi:DUF2141 domain-containing protein [Gramella sp. BOM4]|nr:DUF2141 domain-containing protein [Christiangramia bathymodioli]